MLNALEFLEIGQEITVMCRPPIERRVRRVKHAVFQIFDINWQTRQCWHVSYEIGVHTASARAEFSQSVFLYRWSPVKAPRAHGYQSAQNTLLKQRIIHNAKNRARVASPALIVVHGGKIAMNDK